MPLGIMPGMPSCKSWQLELLGQTRIGDIVCRYGGEEFLVVLPNVTAEIAFQIAERWRRIFLGSTMPFEYIGAKATISCGISEFPVDGNTSQDLSRLLIRLYITPNKPVVIKLSSGKMNYRNSTQSSRGSREEAPTICRIDCVGLCRWV